MKEPKTIEDFRGDPVNEQIRNISPRARQGLENCLLEFGDLSSITLNQRTGELVCGHQRIAALKETSRVHGVDLIIQEGQIIRPAFTDAQGQRWEEESYPYRVVDWPREKQRAANLAANNPGIQGAYTDQVVHILREAEAQSPKTFDRVNLGDIDLLVSKTLAGEKEKKARKDSPGTSDKGLYQILVTCDNEADQLLLMDRLMREGKKCRPLIA